MLINEDSRKSAHGGTVLQGRDNKTDASARFVRLTNLAVMLASQLGVVVAQVVRPFLFSNNSNLVRLDAMKRRCDFGHP
jgi:hypothetical protein